MIRRVDEPTAFLDEASRMNSEGLLVRVRWSRAAGISDYKWFSSPKDWEEWYGRLPEETYVAVFSPLPMRIEGLAGSDFLEVAIEFLDKSDHWLLISKDNYALSENHSEMSERLSGYSLLLTELRARITYNFEGQSKQELREEFDFLNGGEVILFRTWPAEAGCDGIENFVGNVIGAY